MAVNRTHKHLSLAVVGGRIAVENEKLLSHVSFGKIVEAFSSRYNQIFLSAPFSETNSSHFDYVLPDNVALIPQPDWKTTLDSLRHLPAVKQSYKKAIEASDHVFVRGNPVAATSFLYRYCADKKRPICHWLVGNPLVLLQSHKRGNVFKDTLGKTYIRLWEKQLMHGRKIADGSFICNGQEIADRYPSSKTFATVSTTLQQEDFYYREDTCDKDEINILCLCYVRPEKGIEYLLKAVGNLKVREKINLIIAGSRDRYASYQRALDALTTELKIENRVSWLGHVQYKKIPALMRASDIFVLPTLSEGTPRVLVEARANSLPVISTTVGGIPTSVTNEHDGILVPPKNSNALSYQIARVIEDDNLRQKLIKNGYETVKKLTVDRFVDSVIASLSR